VNDRTRELVTLDRRHLWHPFTQMQAWMTTEEVVVIERGEGCWLFDTEGRRYLDGVSSLWCNVHGHRVPAVDDAIRQQLERVAHTTLLGLANVPSIELAARLTRLAPSGLTRVFYSDAGATAVEVALKLAFQYMAQTGRPSRTRFAALGAAYHGDTIGSVSLGGIEVMHGLFDPLRFEVVRLPPPHCYRCPLGLERASCDRTGELPCADEAQRMLEANADSLAALVIEPLVQGAAGMIVHPPGYLARMRAACDRLGLLLVADEVAVGLGRTGTLFACAQENVTPDLLCLAKGLSAGYLPLAATLATEALFEAFLGPEGSQRTFFHGHTYTGNPLGCAAALASLGLMDRVMAELPARIERLADLLDEKVRPLHHVGDVRQRGTMVGIELVQDRPTKQPYPPAWRMGHRVVLEARKLGVIIRPLGDVVVLMPPLAMVEEELELLVQVTAQAILAATADS
jgi:adenosylmethionine-8-amino-7-oxononanoate aminotransferase